LCVVTTFEDDPNVIAAAAVLFDVVAKGVDDSLGFEFEFCMAPNGEFEFVGIPVPPKAEEAALLVEAAL
jgi:hypothetical protein